MYGCFFKFGHQSKLNTIRHKSTVVVVNGMNLFNDPFLQELPKHKDLLKLRDSTKSSQNTIAYYGPVLHHG